MREKLSAFRPTAMTGNPSVLELLAVRSDWSGLRSDLRQVTATSETLTGRARMRIAEAFGVRVLDNYACGECLFLSNGCHTDPGSHVNAD